MAVKVREAFWREMERTYGQSAIHRVLGLSLRVIGEGEVIVEYDGRAEAGNRRGNAAGGALTEMMDSACVQASRTLLEPDDHVTTLELKVNFTRPAPAGAALTTSGRIEYIGRSTAVGLGRIEDPEGKLVAFGIVSIAIRRSQPS